MFKSNLTRLLTAFAVLALVAGCSASKAKPPAKAEKKAETKATLTDAEAAQAYKDLLPELLASYEKSGNEFATAYVDWQIYNTVPYISATHGKRHVNNFANAIAAETYSQFENLTVMPVGSVLAKDSFKVTKKGAIRKGPLFLMEKMEAGFSATTNDWRYSAVMPNGKLMGITNGEKAKKVEFCHACHAALGAQTDAMTFLPAEYRK